MTTQTVINLKCPFRSFFFYCGDSSAQLRHSIYPIQLHMEAQEAFTIFYSESFPGSSTTENLVILKACYLPIYSLATAKSYPQTLQEGFLQQEASFLPHGRI